MSRSGSNLTDISTLISDLRLNLRYSTSDNILGRPLCHQSKALLRSDAASALALAANEFKARGLNILVWDCVRSPEVQEQLLLVHASENYVRKRSNHCLGIAIDLTLCDTAGNDLDMGTDFDHFSPKAHLNSRTITTEQRANRKLLRSVMERAGFTVWPYEWWHFDYLK